MSVAAKISVTDGMSPALRQMLDGVNNLISGLRNLEDEKGRAFDTQELESTAAVMQRLVVGAKVYEQQLNKTRSAINDVNWSPIGGIEIFDTTGIARTEQELGALNDSYERLRINQRLLGESALSMDLLPPSAISDINMVDNKIAQLKIKMALLGTEQSKIGRFNTSGADAFSAKAEDIRRKMARIESLQNDINAAVKNNDIQRINNGYRELNSLVDEVDKSIRNIASSQANLNSNISSGTNKARDMASSLRTAAAFALTAFSGKKITDSTDEYTDTTSRLALLAENEAELSALRAQIYKSSINSRSVFNDSVSNVAKLGLLADDAFGSNEEIVLFDSLMSKAFKVSGSSQQERSAGMYQLTQAMAAGKLQGDEFRSIMENVPLLAQAIADYTGKTKGQLKEMSAEGTITSDVIKAALFSAADDINAKFDTMPKTFGDVMNKIRSDVQYKTSEIKTHINDMLNGDIGTGFISTIGSGIDWLIDRGESLISWFERTAVIAGPNIEAITQDFAALGNSLMGPNGEVKDFLGSLQRIAASEGTRVTLQQLGGTVSFVASGFNSVFGLVTKLNQRFKGFLPTLTTMVITYKSFQIINSTLTSPINSMLGLIDNSAQKYNSLTTAINGTTQATALMNAAMSATKWLTIAGGVMTVVSALASLVVGFQTASKANELYGEDGEAPGGYTADQINRARITGYDLTTISQIDAAKEEYDAQLEYEKQKLDDQKKLFESEFAKWKQEKGDTLAWDNASVTRKREELYEKYDIDSYERQYEENAKLLKEQYDTTLLNLARQDKETKEARAELENLDTSFADYSDPADFLGGGDDGDDVQKVEVVNTVDIASEDLRYMRDMAEQEAINQFTSKLVQPQITVTFGDVHETADVDAIINKLTSQVVEDYSTESDFVHY